ncbi:MAG: outer membrane beta-barrel protein [Ketobacteraceae bacterium]|nr:outer membrane beta-barrel protein [Ketobacteraceae bacterium]
MIRLAIIMLFSFASLAAQAQTQVQGKVFGDIAAVGNDGPSGSDFDESLRFSGGFLLSLSPNVALEAGLSQSTETEDSQTDNTGSYSIKIRSGDVFGGLRIESNPVGKLTFFGRGGVLYYYSEIDFEESFFDIKPGGDLTEIEEGTGYYLGAGVGLPLNPRLNITGEITYRKRDEYFEGADAEFDMKELGAAVGVVFRAF